jgi:hypothetical protein
MERTGKIVFIYRHDGRSGLYGRGGISAVKFDHEATMKF